jgi:hypothetical protein
MENFFRENFPLNHADGDAGNALQVKRRQFLQTIGIAGIALALFPKELFGQCTCAEVHLWRDTVNGLIYSVADGRQASAMVATLNNASIDWNNKNNPSFHDYYASPYLFRGAAIENESVVCGNGFQVNQLPRYDAYNPCRSNSDLNAPEIQTITDPAVIARVNCVLTPNDYRTQVNMSSSDHSTSYERAAIENGIVTSEWHPPVYRRRFRGNSKSYIGHLIYHKTEKERGYPKTKFIVSRDI